MTLWTLLTKTFFDIVDYRVLAKSYEHFEDISESVILNHANCQQLYSYLYCFIFCAYFLNLIVPIVFIPLEQNFHRYFSAWAIFIVVGMCVFRWTFGVHFGDHTGCIYLVSVFNNFHCSWLLNHHVLIQMNIWWPVWWSH